MTTHRPSIRAPERAHQVVHDRTKRVAVSIEQGADLTGTSKWWIKEELRQGNLEAVKAGRRTLILFDSLEKRIESLPKAHFAPPVTRKTRETAAA